MNKFKTQIDTKKLYKGCILASISHCISISKYPTLSNEQSWDNINYNIQDSCGQRGTITFYKDFCIGAFRNENSNRMKDSLNYKNYFLGANKNIITLAEKETLQYLLYEIDNKIKPYITTAFWGKGEIYSNDNFEDMLENGVNLINYQLLDYNLSIEKWIDYYNMDNNEIYLLEYIFNKKLKSNKSIFLTKKELSLLNINSYEEFKEMKTSFEEIGIKLKIGSLREP